MSDQPARYVYPTVWNALRSFRVVGAGTPAVVKDKARIVLEHNPGSKHAAIVFDAYRCSSTLLAAFAAGLRAAVVQEKGIANRGVSVADAQVVADTLGGHLILGGELHGKPVPGGRVGNSPAEACRQPGLESSVLHFQSTNFGRVFVDVVDVVRAGEADTDIFVMSFANVLITAEVLRTAKYDRILLVCGGFYGGLAFEDMALGGKLISELAFDPSDLDDEASTMLACHLLTQADPSILRRTWTARVLTAISKADDVLDILNVSRFPSSLQARLERTVITANFISSHPVLVGRYIDTH